MNDHTSEADDLRALGDSIVKTLEELETNNILKARSAELRDMQWWHTLQHQTDRWKIYNRLWKRASANGLATGEKAHD